MQSWDNDIVEGLPPPGGGEPEEAQGVRRDIIDELGDHLSCAYDREIQRTDDEDEARRNVLDKFGNPAKIAWRLWYDRMKETIMAQRITLGLVAILCCATLFVCYLLWDAMEQNRETNAAMIAEIRRIAEAKGPAAAPAPDAMEWTNVTVKLVDEAGEAVTDEKFRVHLKGNPIQPSEELTLSEKNSGTGVIEFGPIRPGRYQCNVDAPWKQQYSASIVALPGEGATKTIVCPSEPMPVNAVMVEVEWPSDLREQNLCLEVELNANRQIYPEYGSSSWYFRPVRFSILVRGDDSIAMITDWDSNRETQERIFIQNAGEGDFKVMANMGCTYTFNGSVFVETKFDEVASRLITKPLSDRVPTADEPKSGGLFSEEKVVRQISPIRSYSEVSLDPAQDKWVLTFSDDFWDRVRKGLELRELAQARPVLDIVRIRLVDRERNAIDGSGYKAVLIKRTDGDVAPVIEIQSDATGIFDLNNLSVGQYDCSVHSPYGHVHQRSLTVVAGKEVDLEIACPDKPDAVNDPIGILWPDDLAQNENLCILLDYEMYKPLATRVGGVDLWTLLPKYQGRFYRADGKSFHAPGLRDPERSLMTLNEELIPESKLFSGIVPGMYRMNLKAYIRDPDDTTAKGTKLHALYKSYDPPRPVEMKNVGRRFNAEFNTKTVVSDLFWHDVRLGLKAQEERTTQQGVDVAAKDDASE